MSNNGRENGVQTDSETELNLSKNKKENGVQTNQTIKKDNDTQSDLEMINHTQKNEAQLNLKINTEENVVQCALIDTNNLKTTPIVEKQQNQQEIDGLDEEYFIEKINEIMELNTQLETTIDVLKSEIWSLNLQHQQVNLINQFNFLAS